MKSEYLVSIIVPIYNVEKYLTQCLESLYKLDLSRVQIILVDDGSTDSSLSIIKEFADSYARNTTVIEQKNGSVSIARNAGLKRATGEWISFIDSDDFIDVKAMETIYDYLAVCQSDVVAFDGYRYVQENGNTLPLNQRVNPFQPKNSVHGINYLESLIDNKMTNVVTIWDKVYRRSMLERIELQFIENILHEDIAFIFTLFLANPTTEYMDQKAIYYRQRGGSIMSTPSSLKIRSKIKVVEYLLTILDGRKTKSKVLYGYLVHSVKGLIEQGHKVPETLLDKIREKPLSTKKKILLLLLKTKNSQL